MAKALTLTPSIATAIVNVAHYLGEDVALTCTFAAITSIVGWTITLTVRNRFNGSTVLTKTAALTNTATGIFDFTVNDDDFTEPETYEYRIERTNAGQETVLARGLWQVLP